MVRNLSMPPSTPHLTSSGAMRAFLATELMRSSGEHKFPAQLMSVFYWVAAHNGCRQESISKWCDLSPSSVSRCVTWLGPKHRLEHRSGLKLVRRERDPNNYKSWLLYLTPKGEQFTELLDQYSSSTEDSLIKYQKALEAFKNDSNS